ncbi:hypothetical protein [Floridanema aerugineum]|uniref:vWA-MoxR associated protein N-terminal HTH domain-containing protein n=1 Tax=Floridaenema aerugineum BLCC-F46 TaxID=3153654 RepID=A0ABV4X8D1_9CYAN
MDSREVLQFVDEVVYSKTGKHLNDLQRGIIEGTLKRQKYSDIAKDYNCTTGHTKEVGYELWRILSEIFGEPVDKKHLQSVLERQSNLNIFLGNKSNNIINCINFGSEQPNSIPDKSQSVTSDFQQNNNNQIKREKINKLRYFGLTDEQIAEVLELPLEAIKWVEMKE